MVLEDVKSALHKVWYTELEIKLARSYIKQKMLVILSSFLEERTEAVKVEPNITQSFNIEAGIPQGANLSPFLYKVYVSDIPKSRRGTIIILSVDVSKIATSRYKNKIRDYVEEEIHRIKCIREGIENTNESGEI